MAINTYQKLKLKLLFGSRIIKAAEQMWDVVERGIAFEVPMSLDVHNDSIRAVYVLQAMHSDVKVMMKQSRGLVISKHTKGAHGISDEAHAGLIEGGQLEGPEKFLADIVKLSQSNEAFLRSQGLDPEQMVKEAQERDVAKHAIEVGSPGVIPTKPLDPTLDGPDVTPLMKARQRMGLPQAKGVKSELLVGLDGRALEVEVPAAVKSEEPKP